MQMVADLLLDEASSGTLDQNVRESLIAFLERCGEPPRRSYSVQPIDSLVTALGFETLAAFCLSDLG